MYYNQVSIFRLWVFCLFLAGIYRPALGQNPILRSTSTSSPTSISQVTPSVLTQNGTHIGVGTTNPTQALHLYQGNLLVDGTGNNGNITIGNGLGTAISQWAIEYLPPGMTGTVGPGGMNFWKPWMSINGSGGQGFGNYFLFLRNDGKVGVGTECVPPDGRMAVDGKVYARELEIEVNSWCDSVFTETYPLLPIDSLRSYIKSNGHLPGIPSETEVLAKGGMEVMRMNLMLLKKVEELHLYILDMEERLKAVENLLPNKKQ